MTFDEAIQAVWDAYEFMKDVRSISAEMDARIAAKRDGVIEALRRGPDTGGAPWKQ